MTGEAHSWMRELKSKQNLIECGKGMMYCSQRNPKNKDTEKANKISNRFLPKAIRNAVKRKLNNKSNGIQNLRNV